MRVILATLLVVYPSLARTAEHPASVVEDLAALCRKHFDYADYSCAPDPRWRTAHAVILRTHSGTTSCTGNLEFHLAVRSPSGWRLMDALEEHGWTRHDNCDRSGPVRALEERLIAGHTVLRARVHTDTNDVFNKGPCLGPDHWDERSLSKTYDLWLALDAVDAKLLDSDRRCRVDETYEGRSHGHTGVGHHRPQLHRRRAAPSGYVSNDGKLIGFRFDESCIAHPVADTIW